MGENDNPKQDNSSGKGGGSTSEKETPTLTETEAEERASKAVSDALAKAGREAKALENRAKALDTQQWEIDRLRQEQRDAELAAAGDEEAKAKLKRKWDFDDREVALSKERAEVDRDKAQVQADKEAIVKQTRENFIFYYANANNIESNALEEALAELELENPTEKQIENIAKRLASTPPGGKTPAGKKLDSGKTSGASTLEPSTADEKLQKGFEKYNK